MSPSQKRELDRWITREPDDPSEEDGEQGWPDIMPGGEEPSCCVCGQVIAEGHLCTDCDREMREDAERDAATDKSDWPL